MIIFVILKKKDFLSGWALYEIIYDSGRNNFMIRILQYFNDNNNNYYNGNLWELFVLDYDWDFTVFW